MKKMKNKSILILGFAVLFNVNLYSQAIGFEGKRFSADLTVGESVLNKYYQFIYDEIDTENSIYKSVFIPAFRINGSVNYTLSRKYSLGVIFSGSKNSFETIKSI